MTSRQKVQLVSVSGGDAGARFATEALGLRVKLHPWSHPWVVPEKVKSCGYEVPLQGACFGT